MKYKVYRIGQHDWKKGVITIASAYDGEKLHYGVSYCSPKENSYNKHYGIMLASARMEDMGNVVFANSIPMSKEHLSHKHTMKIIIDDIILARETPSWVSGLLKPSWML